MRPLASLSVFSVLVLASCAGRVRVEEKDYTRPLPPGAVALEKITDPRLFPWFGGAFDRRESLLAAIHQSLLYYSKPSSRRHFPYLDIDHARAVASLEAFQDVLRSATSPEEFNSLIVSRFDVYRSVGCDGQGTVLFTGYCEPIYEGSLERTEEFRYPLYRLPKDLVKEEDGTPLGRRTEDGSVVPYPTRGEIDGQGLLAGRGLELVWLKDPFEAYVVHVQGSARIRLRDGREMRIGYAGKTDRPYRSVGQALVADGAFPREELSLQRIKQYFRDHPEALAKYLNLNESYVFFRENDGGPYGSLGVPVTAFRSLATDKAVFPRGALAFVDTRLPASGHGQVPYAAFALDQDTGGAIRSAGRADLFLGTGPEAESLAGRTQQEGKLYYLFVKPGAAVAGRGGADASISAGPGASRSPFERGGE